MTFDAPKTEGDIRLLAELNHQLIRDEGHRNRMTVEELYERMNSWLSKNYEAVLFKVKSDVVGYVLFCQDEERCTYRQIFIVPKQRRKGYGKFAIQKLREEIWSAAKLRLEVLVSNTRGMEFWRSVGFQDYCLVMELE